MSAPEHAERGEHLPAPSIWPLVVGLGIMLLALALVTSHIFGVAGALLLVLGLGGWVRELLHDG